jgi:hypothetical protein
MPFDTQECVFTISTFRQNAEKALMVPPSGQDFLLGLDGAIKPICLGVGTVEWEVCRASDDLLMPFLPSFLDDPSLTVVLVVILTPAFWWPSSSY